MINMKKLSDAFYAGQNNPEAETPLAKRSHRLAHRMGQIIGKYQIAESEAFEKRQKDVHEKWFDQSQSLAEGASKKAFEILRASEKVAADGEFNPKNPTVWLDKFGGSVSKLVWTAMFTEGVDKNPNRLIDKTPLVGLPNLVVDGEKVEVDNLDITCTTKLNEDEVPVSTTTRLFINSRPYDPNYPTGFTNSFAVEIAADGSLSFERSHEKGIGGTYPIQPRETNLNDFLDGVNRSIDQTAQQYQSVAEIPDQL